MGNLVLLRAIAFLILVVIGEYQIQLYINSKKIIYKRNNQNFQQQNDLSSSNKNKLPIIQRQYPKHLIGWAENYLKLPVWSKGYHHCFDNESEVSCFELYRAAKIIEHWDNHSKMNKTHGLVFVNITDEPFFDRLSMLYHGFQIAISSNRALYVDRNAFLPIQLPESIKYMSWKKASNNNHITVNPCENCFQIPNNFQFGCFKIDPNKHPNITFYGASHPQVLYNHHPIGSYLFENFGFHSAHFIGNFLYGSYVKPQNIDSNPKISIEGWKFKNEKRFAYPSELYSFISKCSENPNIFQSQIKENALFVTNEILNESEKSKYAKVLFVIPSNSLYESYVQGIYFLISSEWIISTFGSRMGFWASALLGSKSSMLNTYDRTCFNLTFSQQGSLFHTESPSDLREIFRISDHFYPCGINDVEANKYLENLLW